MDEKTSLLRKFPYTTKSRKQQAELIARYLHTKKTSEQTEAARRAGITAEAAKQIEDTYQSLDATEKIQFNRFINKVEARLLSEDRMTPRSIEL